MRKRAVISDENEKCFEEFSPTRSHLRFCINCFRNGKYMDICPNCGSETEEISFLARPPRARASKMRWKEFFDVFFPSKDFDNTWRRRKAYLRGRK